jgi:hypothetical protein
MSALRKGVVSIGLGAALLLGVVRPAAAYDPGWTRSQAGSYAWYGVKERYVLGLGKFRDNDAWDSDEGEDCSGYVAKNWAIDQYTLPMSNYHPYDTLAFYKGIPYEVFLDRRSGSYLSAWTYRAEYGGPGNHMGHFRLQNSDGTWTTYEAKGKDFGIIIGTRSISTLISWNYRRSDRRDWGSG